MATKLERLASSPSTTSEKLLALVARDPEYASRVVKNPSVDVETLRKIFDLLKDQYSPEFAAAMVLSSPFANAALIREIYADCPGIHIEEDDDYPEETSYSVSMAKNSATPADLIAKLVESPFYMVREKLAARHDLEAEIALKLAKDPVAHVRRILAANDQCPKKVLDLLSNDIDPTTLLKVAMNPNTTLRALRELASDPDDTVRLAILTNPTFR